MGTSEASFHRFHMSNLKKEYDTIKARISKMYDDNLDGRITNDMYDKKLKEYKERQGTLITEMRMHSDADEEFYLTANTVLKAAKRALDIIKSSEPQEKRQFLNYLLQNSKLDGQNLAFELKTPFHTIFSTRNDPIKLPLLDTFRTLNWGNIKKECLL